MPKRALIAFHVLLALALLLILWGFDAPWKVSGVVMLGGLLLAGLACWWMYLVVTTRSKWMAVAPVAVVLTGVLVVVGWLSGTRWEDSAGEFAAYVAELPAPVPGEVPDWGGFTEDVEIGDYTITIGRAVSGGYLFYDADGALFDDAGFLYAPYGPETALEGPDFEGPSYRALGDGWYSVTASW